MKGRHAAAIGRLLIRRVGGRGLIGLMIGILLVGGLIAISLYQGFTRDNAAQAILSELVGIADLKAKQVAVWRNEFLRQALIVSGNPLIPARARTTMASGADDTSDLMAVMSAVQRAGDYHSVLLADATGRVWLHVGAGEEALGSGGKANVLQCVRNREPFLSDLHFAEVAGIVHLDLVIPLVDAASGTAKCDAALLCRVDPSRELYSLVRAWPRPTTTAEGLLVRRARKEAVTLTPCRLRDDRNGEADGIPILVQFVQPGNPGIAEGLDPNGSHVLAAAHPVPGTNWQVIAKMDCDEAMQRVRRETMLASMLMGGLLIVAGGAFAIWEERRRGARFRREAEREHERLALLQRYEWLTRYAYDIILVANEEMVLVEANERAVETYGCPRQELLQRRFLDMFADETRDAARELIGSAGAQEGIVFESTHRRSDGHVFPVEISLRTLRMDDRAYHAAIIRDITDRKQAEMALRALSLKDELTGLLNRRGLMTLGQQGLRVAVRQRNNAVLLFIDIDGLKTVNDTLGHGAGDELLKRMGRILNATCRESDVVARVGGDEFVLLGIADASTSAQRLKERVLAGIETDNARTQGPKLAASVGIAHFDPDQPVTLESLMRVADQAMYEEKSDRRKT